MNINIKKNNFKYAKLLGIMVFLSNMSQIPSLVSTRFSRLLSLSVWILILFLLFVNKKIKFKKDIFPLLIASYIFILALFALTIFTQNNYLNSSILYPYIISIFMFTIGYLYSEWINQENIKFMVYGYALSCLFISVDLYLKYFASGYDWLSRSYAYTSKNSVSQIILTGIIFIYIYYKPQTLVYKAMKLIGISFMILIILMLKSRGSIIGLIVMALMIIISKRNRKLKISTILICLGFIILINKNELVKEIIVEGILLGGREANNLNDISSGRWEMIINFSNIIGDDWLLGKGSGYIENFLLATILQYGVLLGGLVITISLIPMIWGFKYLDKSNRLNIAFLIIAANYWVNGLFEELSPFGPGIKCYILWLLFGILFAWKNKRERGRFSE